MELHSLVAATVYVLVLLFMVTRGDDAVLSEEAHGEVSLAINDFTASLYTRLSEGTDNLVISPLSIVTVLAMVLVGLRGETAKSVSSALFLPENRERVELGFKALYASYKSATPVTLTVANRIYVQEGHKIKGEYCKSVENIFQSTVNLVDFARHTEDVRNAINQWIDNTTNHKIQELIAQGSLDPSTVMMLLNAAYFKGAWEKEIDKNLTSEEKFHVDSETTLNVPMMHITHFFRYGEFGDLDAQVLQIPYEGDRLSLLIFLPKDMSGLKKLEKGFTSLDVTHMLDYLYDEEVTVSLPRFKIESTWDLEASLRQLGLNEILEPGVDFSGITENGSQIYINKVLQKAFIEVNEEGTEAGAGTDTGAIPIYIPPPPQIFKADHPFMFLIVDEMRDTILFMGRVTQPQ